MSYDGIIGRLQREHEGAMERAAAMEGELEAARANFRKANSLIGSFEQYLANAGSAAPDLYDEALARTRLRELVSGFRRATGTRSAIEGA